MFRIRLLPILLAALASLAPANGATLSEDFSSNPLQKGWRIFGDASLFQWDATNQNLRVTWDSSQVNSYFYHPLDTILTRADDFSIAFDLQLTDIGIGLNTNESTSFPIAIGFMNLDIASGTNFIRGTGSSSPDLAEIAYFWDSGFGATLWPTFVDTNSTFNYNSSSDYAVFALTTGDWYHFLLSYTASKQTAVLTMTNFEKTSGVSISQLLNTNFGDYRLGSFSISSYSGAGQDPQYAGSVLAHGIMDNLVVTFPPPPLNDLAGSWSNGVWRVQFTGEAQWVYTLERTEDSNLWFPVSPAVQGVGSLLLSDTNAPASPSFYRVRAQRP